MHSNNNSRFLVLLSILALLLPVAAFGLSIQTQSQHLGKFMGKTFEPLMVVFDGPVNAATLTSDSFSVVSEKSGTLAGTLSLMESNVPGDTVVFTPPELEPDNRYFNLGEHYTIHITASLEGMDGSSFDGIYPLGEKFVPNIPGDYEIPIVMEYSFDDIGQVIEDLELLLIESNMLAGFDPNDPEGTIQEDYWTYPGCSATEAWKITTGHPDVIIAILDNGMKGVDDPELIDNYFLNRGELPLPNNSGTPCADYDCNADGRFNWRDYQNDSRLSSYEHTMPSTLFAAFKDNVDDDGNGLVDDIMGYDFFRDVPEAEGVDEFPEGNHGGGRANDAAASADNIHGRKPGVCPDCTILPIRVGDAILVDFNVLGRAIDYANEMGARLAVVANGTYNYLEETDRKFLEAYKNGTLTLAASGDELGYHHIYPAHGEMAMSIKATLPIPNVTVDDLNLDFLTFLESYCTNHGVHTSVTAPTGACSSHATSITAGAAGLILSRAVDLGIELSSNEVMQLLQMTTDDIKDRCFTFTKGGCKEGWDEHWGYGRINVLRAVQWLGDPEKGIAPRIPPEVEINEPWWFENFHPAETSSIDIEGMIYARGDDYTYTVSWAVGPEPDDDEFIVLAEGSGSEKTNGKLATLDITSIFTEEHLEKAAEDHDDFTVTLKVRAMKMVGGEPVYGEYRKAFAVYNDFEEATGLLPGFPIEFGSSAESSVVLWDLEQSGSGKLDIIFGGGDARIYVYRFNEDSGNYEMAPGFPVDLTPAEDTWPDALVGSVAVGPLLGGSTPYIVAATYKGRLWAVHPNGNLHLNDSGDPDPFLEGFPMVAEKNNPYPNIEFGHGNAYMATPILADLDKDGMLEIIAANYNMNVYAYKPVDADKDGFADDLPGWPVRVESIPGNVDPDKECGRYGVPASILTSPAVAIMDPASTNTDISEYPAVIVATGEVCDPVDTGDDDDDDDDDDASLDMDTSRVYAIYHDGYNNPDGAFLDGWPAAVIAPLGGAIPIPPLTIGVTSSPAVAHDRGRTYIGTGTFLFPPQLFTWEDGEMFASLFLSLANLGASANGTFGHFSDNGMLQYLVPTVGLNVSNILEAMILETFQVTGWNVQTDVGVVFDGWMDDADFFVNPVLADISGDGLPEMICGSAGYMLRAYDINGNQPYDWPKFTQHFITGTPAIGDLDGDGLLEVVLADHEGSLFAWNTVGQACAPQGGASEWYRFRHDEYNSGWLNNDVRPPIRVADLTVQQVEGENTITITFTAPGNDWACGFAKEVDIRYSDDPEVDLSDPEVFEAAEKLDLSALEELPIGGSIVEFEVVLPDAEVFALMAVDAAGNVSAISNLAEVETVSGDDDNEDSDDDDDDDDEGCCG